jgi:hypothetical protein
VFRIVVDDDEDPDDVVDALVFVHDGVDVARLEPPDDDTGHTAGDRVEWVLSFPAYPETRLPGPADQPPVDDALKHVDRSLDAR